MSDLSNSTEAECTSNTKTSVPEILPAQNHPITKNCLEICLLCTANTLLKFYLKESGWALNIRCLTKYVN